MSYVLMSESTPKARKRYCCIWCGQHIEKGVVHRHEKSIYDGRWQNHRFHLECVKAATEHHRKYGEEFEPWDNERPT